MKTSRAVAKTPSLACLFDSAQTPNLIGDYIVNDNPRQVCNAMHVWHMNDSWASDHLHDISATNPHLDYFDAFIVYDFLQLPNSIPFFAFALHSCQPSPTETPPFYNMSECKLEDNNQCDSQYPVAFCRLNASALDNDTIDDLDTYLSQLSSERGAATLEAGVTVPIEWYDCHQWYMFEYLANGRLMGGGLQLERWQFDCSTNTTKCSLEKADYLGTDHHNDDGSNGGDKRLENIAWIIVGVVLASAICLTVVCVFFLRFAKKHPYVLTGDSGEHRVNDDDSDLEDVSSDPQMSLSSSLMANIMETATGSKEAGSTDSDSDDEDVALGFDAMRSQQTETISGVIRVTHGVNEEEDEDLQQETADSGHTAGNGNVEMVSRPKRKAVYSGVLSSAGVRGSHDSHSGEDEDYLQPVEDALRVSEVESDSSDGM